MPPRSQSSHPLTAADESFLSRWMRYFGVSRVTVVQVDSPRADISVWPRPGHPVVYLGGKWRRHRRENPELARRQIVHEGVHVAGYPHSRLMRRLGFWSHDRRRDTLPEAIQRDLERGSRRFSPSRFGLPTASGVTG